MIVSIFNISKEEVKSYTRRMIAANIFWHFEKKISWKSANLLKSFKISTICYFSSSSCSFRLKIPGAHVENNTWIVYFIISDNFLKILIIDIDNSCYGYCIFHSWWCRILRNTGCIFYLNIYYIARGLLNLVQKGFVNKM